MKAERGSKERKEGRGAHKDPIEGTLDRENWSGRWVLFTTVHTCCTWQKQQVIT